MTPTPILDPSKRWECPSCGAQHVTREPRPPTPTHPCPNHHGLTMPYGSVRADGRIEINRNTPTHQYLERGHQHGH